MCLQLCTYILILLMLQVGMAADLKRQTSTDHILAEEFSFNFIFIAHMPPLSLMHIRVVMEGEVGGGK